VALDRQRQFLRPEPLAVVGDQDPRQPAAIGLAFSTSSFTALAGRSTTSPAAMRLTSSGGSRRMVMVVGGI
jgi:hypothetical protein